MNDPFQMESKEIMNSLLDDWKNMVMDLNNVKLKELPLEERMDILLLQHANLKSLLEDVVEQTGKLKMPHRCPVCNGSAFDDEGALCTPCDGRGIVWG